MQRRLEIAEDGVVDAQRPGRREHGFAEPAEVRQEPVALRGTERIQMRHDGIRQQQTVARQHLSLAQDRPARRQPRNDGRLVPGSTHLDLAMNGSRHDQYLQVGLQPDFRNTKYTAPRMHSAAHR